MAPLYLLHRRSVVARLMIAAAFVMLTPCMAPASDELPKETVLPVGLANKAIQASLEACKKDGYKVTVSVVDRAGVLAQYFHADGALPGDHVGIVVGVHEYHFFLPLQLQRVLVGVGI